jgi:hypothetical protein
VSITLHPAQSRVFADLFVSRKVQHALVVASRGFGKSWLAGTAAITAVDELMRLHPKVPNKNVYIIAPTYDQVTDIYYPMLKYQMGLDRVALKDSKDAGYFEFPHGVSLKLVSYEAVERLRGKGAYLIVNDEVASWKKGIGLQEAWESVLEPLLTTRWSPERARAVGAKSPGRSLTISTPMGFDYFYDMSNRQEIDPCWRTYHYDYTHSPFLDPKEIERVRHTVDPIKFAREYRASFEGSGNSVFYCFDRKTHVRNDIPGFLLPDGKHPGEVVHACIDFNVGIQATSFWAIRGNQAHCIDSIQGHPDTETLAKHIAVKYIDRGHKVIGYPDPSGKARKTSAAVGRTDFAILQNAGIKIVAKDAAPAIVDSVACVNRKLKSAAGDVEMFISANCVDVIKSLERTTWVDNNPNLAVIDKKAGVEHFSDGIRYFADAKFPIGKHTMHAARGFGF